MNTKTIKATRERLRKAEEQEQKQKRKELIITILATISALALITVLVIFTVKFVKENHIKLAENEYIIGNKSLSVVFDSTDYAIDTEPHIGYFSVTKNGTEIAKMSVIDIDTYNNYYQDYNKTDKKKINGYKVFAVKSDTTDRYILIGYTDKTGYYLEATSLEDITPLAESMTISAYYEK